MEIGQTLQSGGKKNITFCNAFLLFPKWIQITPPVQFLTQSKSNLQPQNQASEWKYMNRKHLTIFIQCLHDRDVVPQSTNFAEKPNDWKLHKYWKKASKFELNDHKNKQNFF